MTVETSTYISQLNSALPAVGDLKSEGDEHIRKIKANLQSTFPNLTAAPVTASTTELNYVDGVTSNIQTQLDAKASITYVDTAVGGGATYTPSVTGGVARTVATKLDDIVSAFDFMTTAQIADVQAGTALLDVTTALQNALNSNKVIYLPAGKYRITSTLLIDPITNRGNGFIGVNATRYPYTQQSGGPAWNGGQESVIYYDGVTSATAAVISASAEPVGTEPTATFANSVWTLILRDVTLDANSKAGFGFYGARVQDVDFWHVAARGATVAGMSFNGSYSGSIESCRCYLNPGRGFELGDADRRWGWTAQDKNNALYIRDLHCDANGSAAEFRESDAVLKTYSCGAFFGPHRGCQVVGIVSENNFGANIVFYPTSSGNSISGIYTELGCAYAPSGAGTDAITLGYATKQWGLIFVGVSGGYHNRVSDGVFASDYVWLTGSTPSSTREEGAFEMHNIALCPGMTADWAAYRLVNCNLELETITGTSPTGAWTIKGGIQFGAGTTNLDTYEEGTFTATLEGSTIAGTGWTYSVSAGSYTRIGRQVFVTGRINLSAVSSDATGQIRISGLPYTVKNGNNFYSAATVNATSLTTAVVGITGQASINTTKIVLNKRTAAAASESSLVLADLSATTIINFACQYVAA